jgi:arginine utilization regulatory protein
MKIAKESIYKILENSFNGIIIYNSNDLILWHNEASAKFCHDIIDLKEYKFDTSAESKIINNFITSKIILEDGSPVIYALIIEGQRKKETNYKTPKYTFNNIIGNNQKLCEIKILAQRAANSLSPVLIYGETGTGKEMFAQSIHNSSIRKNKPFIAVNCASIPENLFESILFGTARGAYTGSVNKKGLFEEASKGTLFLDEINSMPSVLQAKLLRVLQEKKIRRVGGTSDIEINPRIITSINIEPFKAIKEEIIRSDLFYRLGVICLNIPPLRERLDDIQILTNYYISKISTDLQKEIPSISERVLEIFHNYKWPGNVRQLKHILDSAVILMSNEETTITIDHIPRYLKHTYSPTPEKIIKSKNIQTSLKNDIDSFEKQKIILALEKSKGNITHAAKSLEISRQNLYYKMKKFNIKISK